MVQQYASVGLGRAERCDFPQRIHDHATREFLLGAAIGGPIARKSRLAYRVVLNGYSGRCYAVDQRSPILVGAVVRLQIKSSVINHGCQAMAHVETSGEFANWAQREASAKSSIATTRSANPVPMAIPRHIPHHSLLRAAPSVSTGQRLRGRTVASDAPKPSGASPRDGVKGRSLLQPYEGRHEPRQPFGMLLHVSPMLAQ